MKKLTVVFLIALTLAAQTAAVHAAGAVSFTLDSVSARADRLVGLDMRANGETPLAAAFFTFTFDSTALEFRSVSAPEGSKVEACDFGGRVNVSYLCADGAHVSENAVIFTLDFKTLAEGNAAVDFTVRDCVDPAALQIDCGVCSGGSVAVSSAGGGSQSSAKAGEKATSATKATSPSKPTAATEEKQTATNKASAGSPRDVGTIEKKSSGGFEGSLPFIILCISSSVLAAFAAVMFYRLWDKRKNK